MRTFALFLSAARLAMSKKFAMSLFVSLSQIVIPFITVF